MGLCPLITSESIDEFRTKIGMDFLLLEVTFLFRTVISINMAASVRER
jgi:hypothetical protein